MKQERGNILFLILLAIILFVALNYAVMNGFRNGTPDGIPKEKAASVAALLMQNSSMIEQQIMRARTVDDIPEWGFDFRGSNSLSTANATCTVAACKIFSTYGGSIASIQPPDWAIQQPVPYGTIANFRIVQIVNVGTPAPELVVAYHHLRKEVCDAINGALGLPSATNPPEYYSGTMTVMYSGLMTSFPTTDQVLGEENTSLAGKSSFCFYHPTAGYVFIHTLIAR